MRTGKKQAAPAVRWLEVDIDHSGQRLDNFLLTNLKGVPKSHIYRIVRTGAVRINKGRTRPDYRLRTGDVVRIPPLRTGTPKSVAPVAVGRYRYLEARILYEDDGLLALDKPVGMAVHGGSGIRLGVIEALRALRPQARYLELVHRLDRDTSGCLLVAKKRSMLAALHKLLREPGGDGIDKRYLALVKGRWQGGAKKVPAALQKNVLRSGERMVKVSEHGRPSISLLRPKRAYPHAALVEIQLITGRTHQARVHAAHLGHPIAGDEKYGDRDFNQRMRNLGLKRLFLHAASVSFRHPVNGTRLRISAPLPEDLNSFLKRLNTLDEEKV